MSYQILMENLQASYQAQPWSLRTRWYRKFKKGHRNVENITNILLKYERKSEEWLALSVHTLQLCDTLSKLLHGEKCTREHCARNYEVVSRIVC